MYLIRWWGHMDDFVVLALAALWKAHGCSGPRVCADVEEIVEMAYKTVVGETQLRDSVPWREAGLY